ncbi:MULTISPECIES: methionine-R-sulfoxide reductase [Helicobacter]|uniref:peptide-methionine (R)-S-oxide reductase n=3 Tax=Helicobacteraceae TaxID=72293 RepID=A0A3D8ID77_9HELI|nr:MULTISPECIES: methionine-R-sulfoxide reductase [Helicobacter]RDU62985.1 methionine-R-sulfoxide reductase [Helicobacter ganmani]
MYRKLTKEEQRVILHKGTEAPFSGEFENFFETGIYHCKQCNQALYDSASKFHSGCGWASFDDCLQGAITEQLDADGRRIEITCAKCGGHLGHIFAGEGFTPKNIRHCVNSIAITFEKSSPQ